MHSISLHNDKFISTTSLFQNGLSDETTVTFPATLITHRVQPELLHVTFNAAMLDGRQGSSSWYLRQRPQPSTSSGDP